MAGGITIPQLPSASTLSGSDAIIVQQGGITKRSTVQAGQQLALTAAANAQSAANAAQSTANTALSNASSAQSAANGASFAAQIAQNTADAAQSAANGASFAAQIAQNTADAAQSTADSKLLTVTRNSTLTGNGTAGSPLGVAVTQKKYKGYLTVPGIPVSITFNPIGANTVGSIVWTIPSAGTLVGTLSSAFPATKFFGTVGNFISGSGPCVTFLQRTSDNTIEINIYDFAGNLVALSIGASIPIDITVEI